MTETGKGLLGLFMLNPNSTVHVGMLIIIYANVIACVEGEEFQTNPFFNRE